MNPSLNTPILKHENIPALLNEAVAYHQTGKLAEAERIYRQILSVDPEHADALHLLGVIAHQVGDNKTAIELIERAIRINGGIAIYHNNLGNVLLATGKSDEAMMAFERALILNPGYAEAHMNIGNIFRAQNRLNEAVKSFERSIAINPGYALAYMNLGNTLLDLGKIGEAIASHRKAVTLAPNLPEAHYNLGVALAVEGNINEAIVCFKQTVKLKPDHIEALINLGDILKKIGKNEESVATYERALSLRSDNAVVINNLGNVLHNMGKIDEAIKHYKNALIVKPDLAEAYWNLGNISFDQGKIEEAINYYEQGLKISPDNDEARFYLSLAHFTKTPVSKWEDICLHFLKQPQTERKYEHQLLVRLAIYYWATGNLKKLDETLDKTRKIHGLRNIADDNVKSMLAYEDFLRTLLNFHTTHNMFLSEPLEKEIAIIGDSHCLTYANIAILLEEIPYKIVPHLIVGCKAWHLSRPFMNQYIWAFNKTLDRLSPGTKCIASFGEIDCRHDAGIIKHWKKHGGNLHDIISAFVPGFVHNVATAMRERKLDVSFLNIPAPNVESLRSFNKNFTSTDEENLVTVIRTFNELLAIEADKAGCEIIDVYSVTARPDGRACGRFHTDGIHLRPDVLELALNLRRKEKIDAPSTAP